jgi:ribosomal subunit interface protein
MTNVEIVVRGRHTDVSARFKELATDKLSRVEKFGIPMGRVDVEVSKENNPRLSDRAYEVELTCRSKGPVIRAEAWAADKYTALDLALARLEERLRRAHDKARFHRNGRAKRIELPEMPAPVVNEPTSVTEVEVEIDFGLDDEVYAEGPVVVRDKTHPTTPMSIEQAVTEMELVGHDFFLFEDLGTGEPAVVYRRRGFDYGLIRIQTTTSVEG